MEARFPKIPMFQELELVNFRGFRSEKAIKFAPLTFIVGPNSSGKSSVFDAILLIVQSEFWQFYTKIPVWIGDLVDLGSFLDSVYRHKKGRSIRIGLTLPFDIVRGAYRHKKDKNIKVTFKLTLTKQRRVQTDYLEQIICTDVTSGVALTLRYAPGKKTQHQGDIDGVKLPGLRQKMKRRGRRQPFSFVMREVVMETLTKKPSQFVGKKSAVNRILKFFEETETFSPFYSFMASTQRVASGRGAPKRFYPRGGRTSYGIRSLFSPSVFDNVEPEILEPSEPAFGPFYPRRKQFTKKDLEKRLDMLKIASKVVATNLSPYHSTIEVTDSVTKVCSKLIDVGYGASQVIPVIAACLSGFTGALFVEQPEIHLHPSAQGVVAELLVETSKRRQVIVETHSEHLINRARIMIARGDISAEHVIINYVDRDRSGSYIKRIPLNANGDFEAEWPQGFFDERYHDTVQLMRLKNRGGK